MLTRSGSLILWRGYCNLLRDVHKPARSKLGSEKRVLLYGDSSPGFSCSPDTFTSFKPVWEEEGRSNFLRASMFLYSCMYPLSIFIISLILNQHWDGLRDKAQNSQCNCNQVCSPRWLLFSQLTAYLTVRLSLLSLLIEPDSIPTKHPGLSFSDRKAQIMYPCLDPYLPSGRAKIKA